MTDLLIKQSETVNDEFNLNEEEIIQELEDEDGFGSSNIKIDPTIVGSEIEYSNSFHIQMDHSGKYSPSKSNKVPSSLAFKRRSNHSSKEDLIIDILSSKNSTKKNPLIQEEANS